MAKAFSIRDFMQDTRQQDSNSDVYEKVSVYDIGLNPKNEYTMSEIEKIKDSIYALGGVQQNVVLIRCPDGADHKYLALDGHRRLTASRELVAEGHGEFEFVPAVIKGRIEPDAEEAMLIMMNSTQRNKTDWERVMEHMRLKEIIPKLKKRRGLDGRTRDIEADMLGVSQTQVAVYNTIGTRLNSDLMEMFRLGSIGISLAYEAAKQEINIQEQVADLARRNGSVTEEDIKQISGSRVCDGQLELSDTIPSKNVSESDTSGESGKIETPGKDKADPPTDDEILCLYNHIIKEYDGDRKNLANNLKEILGRRYSEFHCSEYSYQFSPKGVKIDFANYTTSYAELVRRINTFVPREKNVSESDTSGETVDKPVPDLEATENVPESGTSDEIKGGSIPDPKEEKRIYYTSNKDNIDDAIYHIFRMDDFPEDKLRELTNCFAKAVNFYSSAAVDAADIFNEMLPYEGRIVKVRYFSGYRIDYILTGEAYVIPTSCFWEGFIREFETDWKKNGITEAAGSDADAELSAATDSGERKLRLRGGYEPCMVDYQISKYEEYLIMSLRESRAKQIHEYNCLLDALYLLKERLAHGAP